MIYALTAIIAILAVFLILIVLAQDSKSGALSSNFGGSQLMGVKRTTDLLEKLTWGFMIGIMVLTMGSKFLQGGEANEDGPSSLNVEKAKSTTIPAAPQKPSVGPTPPSGADSSKSAPDSGKAE
jgi:preprotein translocase subunit SecG